MLDLVGQAVCVSQDRRQQRGTTISACWRALGRGRAGQPGCAGQAQAPHQPLGDRTAFSVGLAFVLQHHLQFDEFAEPFDTVEVHAFIAEGGETLICGRGGATAEERRATLAHAAAGCRRILREAA